MTASGSMSLNGPPSSGMALKRRYHRAAPVCGPRRSKFAWWLEIGDDRPRSLKAAVPPRWARVLSWARFLVFVYAWSSMFLATG